MKDKGGTILANTVTFQYNFGLNGAIVNCEGCQTEFTGVTVEDNQCNTGCVIYSNAGMPGLSFDDCTFTNNFALQEAAFAYIELAG